MKIFFYMFFSLNRLRNITYEEEFTVITGHQKTIFLLNLPLRNIGSICNILLYVFVNYVKLYKHKAVELSSEDATMLQKRT